MDMSSHGCPSKESIPSNGIILFIYPSHHLLRLPVTIIGLICNSRWSNLNLITLSKTLFLNQFIFIDLHRGHKYIFSGDTIQHIALLFLYSVLLSCCWWCLSEFTSLRNPQTMWVRKTILCFYLAFSLRTSGFFFPWELNFSTFEKIFFFNQHNVYMSNLQRIGV